MINNLNITRQNCKYNGIKIVKYQRINSKNGNSY